MVIDDLNDDPVPVSDEKDVATCVGCLNRFWGYRKDRHGDTWCYECWKERKKQLVKLNIADIIRKRLSETGE